MPDVLKSNRNTSSLDRSVARTRILSARFTHEEYAELERHAWSKGTTLADWVHETLIGEARGQPSGAMDMHIFIELVGIQMLLMSTFELLLRCETRTPDQVANLFRQVQTTKAAKAKMWNDAGENGEVLRQGAARDRQSGGQAGYGGGEVAEPFPPRECHQALPFTAGLFIAVLPPSPR